MQLTRFATPGPLTAIYYAVSRFLALGPFAVAVRQPQVLLQVLPNPWVSRRRRMKPHNTPLTPQCETTELGVLLVIQT